MRRRESKQAMLSELGAAPVVVDALDPDQVAQAVGEARPDVIVHELTAIGALDMRHFDRDFALTNRLRTEGTDHLLSAGQAVGVRRFVAQSYGAWFYVRTGGPVKSEEDPLDPTLAREMRETLAAIRHLEEAVRAARWTEGIVLRYGAFYGPGTSMVPGGEQFELVRRRKFPLVGDGGGVWSFIHIRRGGGDGGGRRARSSQLLPRRPRAGALKTRHEARTHAADARPRGARRTRAAIRARCGDTRRV